MPNCGNCEGSQCSGRDWKPGTSHIQVLHDIADLMRYVTGCDLGLQHQTSLMFVFFLRLSIHSKTAGLIRPLTDSFSSFRVIYYCVTVRPLSCWRHLASTVKAISSLSNQPGVSQFSQLLGGDKKTIISSQCNVYSGESFNGAC